MLDYTKVKKQIFSLKLYDSTVLQITMPKKKTFEKMADMQSVDTDALTAETISEIYELAAEIISNNLQKKKYTADELGEIFDLNDIVVLLNEYMAFAGYVAKDPN